MKIKEYLIRIISNGRKEDMEKLGDILDEAIYKVKECDEEWYEEKCMKLYTMAYGKVINEEMAKEIVDNMKPSGEHWDIEQTRQVQIQNGLNNIRDVDFYLVFNMAYNDYYDIFEDNTEMYIKYAKKFILDEDAKDDKVFLYFTTIPK